MVFSIAENQEVPKLLLSMTDNRVANHSNCKLQQCIIKYELMLFQHVQCLFVKLTNHCMDVYTYGPQRTCFEALSPCGAPESLESTMYTSSKKPFAIEFDWK